MQISQMPIGALPASTDPRNLWQRLRRIDCQKLADVNNIEYDTNWPKTKLVELLKIKDVDPTQGLDWERMDSQDEEGKTVTQYYPRREIHASAKLGVDATNVLNERIEALSKAESQNKELEQDNQSLREDNATLKAQVAELMAFMNSQKEDGTDKSAEDEVQALRAAYKVKFGKNPHSAMKIEKLKVKLSENTD